MTIASQPYADGRSAERKRAGRGATLRDAVYRPIDIVIADLSATGFGMTTAEDLAVGSYVNLSLAGICKRDVRVVRRYGMNYGCEFIQPLSPADLDLALKAGVVVGASFAIGDGSERATQAAGDGRAFKASPRIRALVLVATVAVLWLAVLYTARLLVTTFAVA